MPVLISPCGDTAMRYSPPPTPRLATKPLPNGVPTLDRFTFRVDVTAPDFKQAINVSQDTFEYGPAPKRQKI